MLELLLVLALSASLISSAASGYTTYLSSLRHIEANIIGHTETMRVMNMIDGICKHANQRFGVHRVSYTQNHQSSPAELDNGRRARVKLGSSSISLQLADTTNVFSRDNGDTYCSPHPPETDTRSFLIVSEAGQIESTRMKHKTRCLLAQECPCKTNFSTKEHQGMHTIFASSLAVTFYLASSNTLYWLAHDTREHQPLAYNIEHFRVNPLSEKLIEFEIKHLRSPAVSLRCAFGPKDYHVLDSIF